MNVHPLSSQFTLEQSTKLGNRVDFFFNVACFKLESYNSSKSKGLFSIN